jgi:hypothetical protein
MKFKNDIEAQAGFKDAGGDLGVAGQLLSSTGTETNWIDQSTIASGSAEVVEVPVKNLQGSALTKGDPVYISGSVGASGILEVQLADAGNSAKMPAVGLLKQDLAANGEGFVVVTGKLRNLITSPIDGVTPNPNTVIYVKSGGSTGAALTTVKPGGSTNLVQNVGKVGRVSTSADGTLVVSSILRSNDVPNLPLGRLFVGTNTNTSLTSDVVYIDDANDRVGIGTTSPVTKLHVEGNVLIDAYNQGEDNGLFFREGFLTIDQPSITVWDMTNGGASPDGLSINANDGIRFRENGGEVARFKDGNFGIGTTSPSTTLQVYNSTEGQYMEIGAGDGGGRSLVFTSSNNNGSAGALHTINAKSISGAIALATAGSERMRITNTGNVGIGATSFSGKLSVNESGSGVYFTRNSGDNGTTGPVLAFANDSTKSIIAAAGDGIVFRTRTVGGAAFSGSERMRITSTGNVGIGTTSPTTKLHVLGTTSSMPSLGAAASAAQIGGSSYGTLFSTLTSGRGVIQQGRSDGTATSYDLLLQPVGGNVGIGTTSPVGKLHVDSGSSGQTSVSSSASDLVLENSSNSGISILSPSTTSGNIFFGDESDFFIGGIRYYHTNDSLLFYANNSERVRINSSGNVGIGTTSPGAKLSIGGASGELLKLDDSSATGNPFISIWQAGVRRSYIQYVDSGDNLSIASEYGGIRFLTGTGGTETEKMRILSGGNVGIGITSPSQTLEVAGTGIKLVNAANTHTHLLLDTATYDYKLGDISTSGGAYMQILSSTNQTFIYNSDLILSNNYQVKLTRDNVTSTTADSCIYVDNAYTGFGNPYNIDSDLSSQFGSRHIGFRYNGTIVGYIGANGTTAVTYSTTSSDERLKKNIEDWQENILDKFEKIEPKKFNFISEEEGESKTKGFIAQNMAEDFPEAYPHDYSEDKYYSFNPSGMVVYLMKAVKDLVEQNKQLETRIQILEQQK